MFSALLAKLGIKGFASVGGEGAANKLVKFNSEGLLDPSVVQVDQIDHDDLSNVGSNTHTQIDNHIASTANPHSVTKTQVGLGNCDNTSDINKPVSTATQTALDLKASTSSLSSHTGNTSNPHSVTKTQVGLGNCDNTSDANKPISTAAQTALDLKADLASPILTGTPAAPTATSGTNNTQIATTAFVKTAVDNLVAGAPGTLDTLNEIAARLENDEDTVSALITTVAGKVPNTRTVNGHALSVDVTVTKSDVGLGNADNTSDVNKPVSTATQTALDLKASTSSLSSHTSNTSNPHSVTKSQVGLGNCDNTSDVNKPVSTATQTALDLKADTSALSAHTSDTDNPHSVTKSQVGLSNADNTADIDKPISTDAQDALDAKLSLAGGTMDADSAITFSTGATLKDHNGTNSIIPDVRILKNAAGHDAVNWNEDKVELLRGATVSADKIVDFESGASIVFDTSGSLRANPDGVGIDRVCAYAIVDRWKEGRLWYLDDGSPGTVRLIRSTFDEVPDVNYDSTQGVVVGTFFEAVDGSRYQCTDATPTAAVWVSVGGGGGGPTPVTDGTYTVGLGVTSDGTITVEDGVITEIVEASVDGGGSGEYETKGAPLSGAELVWIRDEGTLKQATIETVLSGSNVATLGTHTYASTIDLDFTADDFETVTLNGDITFTTSNLAAARSKTIRIIGDDSSVVNCFFPGGWIFVGAAAPTSVGINKVCILTLTAFGNTDVDVIAAFAESP